MVSSATTETGPGSAERRRLLAAGTGSRVELPLDATIHRRFAERAAAHPEAVALVDGAGGGSWTYGELDRAADRLAAALGDAGLRLGDTAVVAVPRSPHLVVSLLAVLKAGAAYLPVERDEPPQRLAGMIADAGARVAVVAPGGAALPEGLREVPTDATGGALRAAAPPASAPAYVMFTSGSTGRPKGVAVPHRAVLRLVESATFAALDASQTWLHLAPAAFDASTLEVWGCLLHGGRLVVAPPGPLSLREIGRLVREHAVTSLWLTAGLFHQMVDGPLEDLAGLRQLLAGGDVLSPAHVRRFVAALPACRLVNGYGPTESTTFACCHTVTAAPRAGEAVPIGRPIQGTLVAVLDGQGELAAAGEAGEVAIGGEGVAIGYLARRGLTADRFVPDPFSGVPGARLYRTGDLARWRADGSLDFLGRRDGQVKVRGHRVELGEVEAALAEHPAVVRAAAAVRGEGAEGRQVVAWVVPAPGAALDEAELRSFLRRRLPPAMVPAAVSPVDELPLGPTGKVDRDALPDPTASRAPREGAVVPPATPLERRLAALWSELLGWAEIGRHDDFFVLGGHSLAATQLVARIEEAFGCELSLTDVFAAPDLAALAAAVESRLGAPRHSLPLAPVPRDRALPLSFSQERVWLLGQLEPDSLAYNFQAALRFRGPLSVSALNAALSGVVARHEVFRTTFPSIGGRPVQQVHPPFAVPLPLVDLSALPAERREQAAARTARRLFARRFDPARLPLLRWVIFRFADDEHRLLHIEHHLIHDGWSFNRFVAEVYALYAAAVEGRPADLPDLPVQFADLAVWQRRWMEGEEMARQLAFWTERLDGAPATIELPYDRPRPLHRGWRGAAPRSHVPAALYRRLRRLADEHKVSLFMLMLAVFYVLLHRYTGQSDLCVGSGIANRRHRASEPLLGMIVNNLVLRADLSGEPTFFELLARVRALTLDAYRHQDLPFDRLVEALRPNRHPGQNPLFQVMFNFHDAPLPELAVEGLEATVEEGLSNRSAKFDLNLIAIPRAEQRTAASRGDEGVTLVWEHSRELFDAATMDRLIAHYHRLLASVVEAPAQRIGELAMLSSSERRFLLAEFNHTASDFPRHRTLDDLVAEQARRAPDAPAVDDGERTLRYGELVAGAARLAHHLVALGVRPGDRVGLCLERSADAVVALLAILQAGAAYVPLDPALPAARTALLVGEVGIGVVITRAALAGALPPDQRQVRLDDDAAAIAGRPSLPPAGLARPDSLAYVVFTSGSTGRPKGVAVSHRAVARLVLGVEYVAIAPGDTVAQAATLSFDAATFEIWGALCHGARLAVVAQETALVPGALAAEIRRRGIDVMFLTTALFQQAARDLPDAFAPLGTLLFGGEQADPAWVRRVLAAGPPRRLLHAYGPTECTTFATVHAVREVAEDAPSVSIGRPIANTRAYVVDAGLRPVPPGAVGELVLGGEGLALGYWGRAALTAESFVPDPFVAGERLYRTGDLVRLDRAGDLHFVGRRDQQVKIRGFRIEPGEIEAALVSSPVVRQAAVLTDRSTGELRLVAYWVPAEGASDDANELRRWLRGRLPEHMVPAAFVALPSLPLTASGKIDRHALPAPSAAPAAVHVAPRDEGERLIAEAWREVLDLDRVGVDDNFFDLGGHSLLLTRVHGRLEAALGRRVPIVDLFHHPTVATLARHLGAAGGDAAASDAGRDEQLRLGLDRIEQLHRLQRAGSERREAT